MLKTYYHATDYKNLVSILENGIRKGCDGVVYLANKPEGAATFAYVRGVKDIIVFAVELDDSKVVESFDHSPSFFRCRAWMHKGTIVPEYISRMIRYDMIK